MKQQQLSLNYPLNYTHTYSCPVCHHGEISNLALMDAFACNFCSHIFTADLEKQVIEIADSQLPLSWRWNGRTWKRLQPEGVEIGWSYLLIALGFVLIPPSLIGISLYLFPPLPNSPLSWFPVFWIVLTFFCHLLTILWLVVEYYQFPINLYFRAIGQRLWG